MQELKEKRIQLAIDIDEGLRHQIKLMAIIRNIPMKTWILRALKKEYLLQAANPLKKCECFQDYDAKKN